MSTSYYEEEDFQASINRKTLGRILSLIVPHIRWTVGFLFAILVVSGLDAVFTFLSKRIVDEGIVAKNASVLTQILIIYGILIIVQALGVFVFIYLASILGERIRYDLRRRMFNHLQKLSLSYFSRTPVGWIMARVTSDSDRVAELVTWGLLDTTWALMNIVTSMGFMLYLNWRLALIVLLMIPLLVYVGIQFRKRILGEFRNVRKINSRIVGSYNENITGVRVVKGLGREAANLKEFQNLTNSMYASSYRAAWLSALFLPTVQIISAFAVGGVVVFSGLQTQFGGMSVGSIQAFVSYITFMMWPVQDLARVFAEMQHAIASAERMFSLLDTQPKIIDRPDSIDPGTIYTDIVFDHVNFSYEDGEPVLEDINLKVKPGETIALVGATGGGKTTMVNLLCRFYEPTGGKILFGGRDYTTIPLHAIHSKIGIVLQNPHLFSGTIRENLRYGRLDATDEEIDAAVRMVSADKFIAQFEKGMNQDVGEGGNLLSVGQKQLISLARAVLAKPELFIMDEATSSVDTLTEVLIQKAMGKIMSTCTSFVIAHRLSTIKKADRIIVIEEGKIAEIGTHSELLRKGGKYYLLYTSQFRHQLEEEYDPFKEKAIEAA